MSTSDRLQEHHNSLCQSGQMHAALVEQFLMVDDALGVRPVSAALRSAKINSTFLDNVLTCSCGPDTHETRHMRPDEPRRALKAFAMHLCTSPLQYRERNRYMWEFLN